MIDFLINLPFPLPLLGAIFAIVVLLLIAVHIYEYFQIWNSARHLKSELYKTNRTLSLKEVKERIARKEGIILVEAPTIGWDVDRVWWSSRTDFVPFMDRDEDDPSVLADEIENYNRFLDPVTGTACLVDGFVFSQNVRKYLLKHFHSKDCVFIRSGMIFYEKDIEELNSAGEDQRVKRIS